MTFCLPILVTGAVVHVLHCDLLAPDFSAFGGGPKFKSSTCRLIVFSACDGGLMYAVSLPLIRFMEGVSHGIVDRTLCGSRSLPLRSRLVSHPSGIGQAAQDQYHARGMVWRTCGIQGSRIRGPNFLIHVLGPLCWSRRRAASQYPRS